MKRDINKMLSDDDDDNGEGHHDVTRREGLKLHIAFKAKRNLKSSSGSISDSRVTKENESDDKHGEPARDFPDEISFDIDDCINYGYATPIKCDTKRGTAERCTGTVIWEKNGSACYECGGAFCEGCCCDEGEYDSDDNFFCGECAVSTGESMISLEKKQRC